MTGPDYSFLAAFDRPISRPRTSIFYHFGLLLTAVTMVLLLLVYFALGGLLAYGIYYYAVHHWNPYIRGRFSVVLFLFESTPLLAGVVVLFFMFKPLFAGRPKRAQPLSLNPAHEPLLYAFIEKICDAVGAPSPKRIDLNCELNAFASFRRGIFSFFENDLVLTIGLPLVANMSTRDLAGIVAHEFGHFTQGAGMRLSYVVRRISMWFMRVAYERDAWDVAMRRAIAASPHLYFSLMFMAVQAAVEFSRYILRLLMFIGVAVTGFMLRQMEYDADAYNIAVTGSDSFEQTQRRFAGLQAALTLADNQLIAWWRETRSLPDNLPEVIRQCHEQLPPDVLQEIDDTLGLSATGIFDSHPSPADRIRRARQLADPGIFHDDRPASSLFASFDHPARFVTFFHYTDDLGIPVKQNTLRRVITTTAPSAVRVNDNARDDYFLGILPLMLPLRLSPPAPSTDMESQVAEFERVSSSLGQIRGQLAPIASQYAGVLQKLIQIRCDLAMQQAVSNDAPGSAGSPNSLETLRAAEAEAVAAMAALRHSTREVADALKLQLHLALSLRLTDPGEFGTQTISTDRVNELVASLNRLAEQYAHHETLITAIAVLEKIVVLRNTNGETPALTQALATQANLVRSLTAGSITASEPPRPGLHLARRQPTDLTDIEDLRSNLTQWFAEYHGKIEELCQIAQGARVG